MTSPLIRALTEYEQQLAFHAVQAKAFKAGADARVASIAACASEVEVQCQGLDAALSNLGDHHRTISALHTSFQDHFSHAEQKVRRATSAPSQRSV